MDPALDDRNCCGAAFLVFEASVAFGLAQTAVFLAGAAGLSVGRELGRAAIVLPLLLRLGFVSPRIVEAIAEGRQPPGLTVIGLTWSGVAVVMSPQGAPV